ncbi:MAG: cell division protein FtsZ, partial [Rhodospirillales bacterium]
MLTVGVITKPFHFEGQHRMKLAESGIEELQQTVDTLIIIPNQNLFRVANERTTFADAFKMADDVLYSGVRGVTDLMVMPGLINLDFADIRSVMGEMGKAMMGTGEAEGDSRAIDAAQKAISNPLLDDVSMKGAKGVLINITGGMDMTLFEVDEAANRIRDEVDPEANIIFGSTFDETLNGRMRVSVVATGIDAAAAVQPKPQTTVVSFARPAARPTVPAPMTTTAPAAVAAATSIPAMPNMVPATVAQSAPIQQTATALKLEAAPIPVFEAAPLAAPALPLAVEPAPVAAQPVAPQPVEAYIPPKPVEVAQAAASPANPFAEAELVNAAKTAAPAVKPAPRKVSLFERMTRTGQARSEAAPAAAEPVRSQPPLAAPIGAMTLPTQPAAAAAPAPATAPAAPATSQPRLGGLDPADRIQSKTEDDLLEIPAFLRRQAN